MSDDIVNQRDRLASAAGLAVDLVLIDRGNQPMTKRELSQLTIKTALTYLLKNRLVVEVQPSPPLLPMGLEPSLIPEVRR